MVDLLTKVEAIEQAVGSHGSATASEQPKANTFRDESDEQTGPIRQGGASMRVRVVTHHGQARSMHYLEITERRLSGLSGKSLLRSVAHALDCKKRDITGIDVEDVSGTLLSVSKASHEVLGLNKLNIIHVYLISHGERLGLGQSSVSFGTTATAIDAMTNEEGPGQHTTAPVNKKETGETAAEDVDDKLDELDELLSENWLDDGAAAASAANLDVDGGPDNRTETEDEKRTKEKQAMEEKIKQLREDRKKQGRGGQDRYMKPRWRWMQTDGQIPTDIRGKVDDKLVLKGLPLLRAVSIGVLFAIRLQRDHLQHQLSTRESEARATVTALNIFLEQARSYLGSSIRAQLVLLLQDTALNLELQPSFNWGRIGSSRKKRASITLAAGGKLSKLALRLKVRIKGIVERLCSQPLPDHVKKVLASLVSDGRYFPPEFLFPCERSMLQFTAMGTTSNMFGKEVWRT